MSSHHAPEEVTERVIVLSQSEKDVGHLPLQSKPCRAAGFWYPFCAIQMYDTIYTDGESNGQSSCTSDERRSNDRGPARSGRASGLGSKKRGHGSAKALRRAPRTGRAER